MSSAPKHAEKERLYCSFCRKSDEQVAKLVAGPAVFICDACVALCAKVMEESGDTPSGPAARIDWPSDAPNETLLAMLKGQEAALEEVGARLQKTIETLRARDVSWAVIGAALGVSRQAAWERFG